MSGLTAYIPCVSRSLSEGNTVQLQRLKRIPALLIALITLTLLSAFVAAGRANATVGDAATANPHRAHGVHGTVTMRQVGGGGVIEITAVNLAGLPANSRTVAVAYPTPDCTGPGMRSGVMTADAAGTVTNPYTVPFAQPGHNGDTDQLIDLGTSTRSVALRNPAGFLRFCDRHPVIENYDE